MCGAYDRIETWANRNQRVTGSKFIVDRSTSAIDPSPNQRSVNTVLTIRIPYPLFVLTEETLTRASRTACVSEIVF